MSEENTFSMFNNTIKELQSNKTFKYKITLGKDQISYRNINFVNEVCVLSNSDTKLPVTLEVFFKDVVPYNFEITKYHLD